MATDLERLVVSLSADIKSFEKSMAKASGVSVRELRKINSEATKSMTAFEKTMGRGASALAGFGKGLVLGGIATAVAGLGAIIKSSVETAANIGDLAEKLGISSDKLQELQYGAVQANMSFEELEASTLKFSKALGEARNGQGALLKTLEANGFDKAKIRALSYSDALDVVADLVKNAANEQDAMLIITQAFGRGGDEMLEFLRNGSAGLKGFGDDARRASSIIDKELIASAQKFDDAWARAVQGAKSNIANWSLYAITQLAKFGDKAIEVSEDVQKALGLSNNIESFAGTKMGKSSQAGAIASPKGDRQATTVIPDPEAEAAKKAAIEAATKAYEAQQKAINGVIEALQFEIKQGQASELQQEINNELRKAGTTATEEQKQKIIELTTAKFNMARAEQEAIDAGEKFLEQQAELKDLMDDFGQTTLDAFESIISGGEDAADVLKKLAIEFIKTAIKAKALGDAAGGAGGGAGGFLSGIIGSLFGGSAPNLYAKGGTMKSGEYGIVGDAGPELMKGPGTVIPFNKLGGGGGYKVTVNNYGAQVQTRERTDSMGRKELILLIKNQVQEETANPYSRTSGTLNARGARPALKQR